MPTQREITDAMVDAGLDALMETDLISSRGGYPLDQVIRDIYAAMERERLLEIDDQAMEQESDSS